MYCVTSHDMILYLAMGTVLIESILVSQPSINCEDIFVAAARKEFEYMIKNYLLKSCI